LLPPRTKLYFLYGKSYLLLTANANSLKSYSTFCPVFADVSISLIFFYFAHDFTFYIGIALYKSHLLPTKNIIDDDAFA
jgi:hypothetical protein